MKESSGSKDGSTSAGAFRVLIAAVIILLIAVLKTKWAAAVSVPTVSCMTDRDPYKFLASLTEAFNRRQATDSTLTPQFHYFRASMEAVSVRFSALDRLAAAFPSACVNVNTDLGKRQEQHQLLFDFFSNAWASVESFCCGSYFIGSVLDPVNFPFGIPQSGHLTKLKKINPKETLDSYNRFEPNAAFTRQLQAFWDSNEYKLISAMRILLEHRIIPGRTIRPLAPNVSHSIDLDIWYDGDVYRLYGGSFPPSGRVFELDDNCLSKQRDWLDVSIHDLSEKLGQLAAAKGLV
jgi:hypothetical protein